MEMDLDRIADGLTALNHECIKLQIGCGRGKEHLALAGAHEGRRVHDYQTLRPLPCSSSTEKRQSGPPPPPQKGPSRPPPSSNRPSPVYKRPPPPPPKKLNAQPSFQTPIVATRRPGNGGGQQSPNPNNYGAPPVRFSHFAFKLTT